jgi:UDP-N-acetylmuramate dehydrogenase
VTFSDAYAHLLQRGEPLARYTAARLGGAAEYLYIARADDAELRGLLRAAWAAGVAARVLGGGANVLVSDDGVRGLVIINQIGGITFEDERVRVGSGVSLTVLARKCASGGLAGFAWAVSVPGTVGGAVVNNAGAHGGDMAGSVETVSLFTPDGDLTLTLDDLGYAYRESALKRRADRRFFITGALLRLQRGDSAAIQAQMDEFIAHRKRTQPPGASLGSIFKNPPGDYAGRLIESCGLKGCGIGGAQVSPIHANFFINTGSASARDYLALVEHVRAEVQRQTGVLLETEIEVMA